MIRNVKGCKQQKGLVKKLKWKQKVQIAQVAQMAQMESKPV
jgi:hypothetical protein